MSVVLRYLRDGREGSAEDELKTKSKTQGKMVEMRQIWFETRFYLLNFLYFPFSFVKDFFSKTGILSLTVIAHTFNANYWEAESGGSL